MARVGHRPDPGQQRQHTRIAQTIARDMRRRDLIMHQHRRSSKPQRILRLGRGSRRLHHQSRGFSKGPDRNPLHLLGLKPVRALEPPQRIQGGMGPATDRIGFDIVPDHGPVLPQIAPDMRQFRRLHGDRRGTCKAALGHQKSLRPNERPHARTVMQHRGIVDLAHHLAARSVIFGDAQRLAQNRRAAATQPRAQRRNAQGVPGPGRVIIARGRM